MARSTARLRAAALVQVVRDTAAQYSRSGRSIRFPAIVVTDSEALELRRKRHEWHNEIRIRRVAHSLWQADKPNLGCPVLSRSVRKGGRWQRHKAAVTKQPSFWP